MSNSASCMEPHTPLDESAVQAAVIDTLQRLPLRLDASRTHVVKEAAATLCQLVQGLLVDSTSHRRLLLGRKGVGKTLLLNGLIKSASKLLGAHGLLCVSVSYDQPHNNDRCVVELVRRELLKQDISVPERFDESVSDLEKWLAQQGKFLFLVLDEFHLVFTPNFQTNGKMIVMEAMALGSALGGRIHCVLSGSSSVVRRLCFGKMPSTDETRAVYPNYTAGVDLNSTKFTAVWIDPFVDAADFRAVAQMVVNKKRKPMPDDDQLALAYLYTGGNGRLMDRALPVIPYAEDRSPYTLISGVEDCRQALRAIVDWLMPLTMQSLQGSAWQSSLEEEAARTALVPLRSLEHMDAFKPLVANKYAGLYNLVDRGLIRMRNGHVGLGHAGLWMEVTSDAYLTAEEVFAMLHPVDQWGEDAEHTTLRLLTRSGGGAIKLLMLEDRGIMTVGELVLFESAAMPSLSSPGPSPSPPPDGASSASASSPSPLSPLPPVLGPVAYRDASLPTLLSRVWKECFNRVSSDALGGDAVVFQLKEGERVLVAHRIQIKLGRGTKMDNNPPKEIGGGKAIGMITANEVVARFSTMRDTAEKAYKRVDLDRVEQQHYLLTTRVMAPNAQATLKTAGIQLFHPRDLSTHLWPDSLKSLGKPFVRS